MTDEWLHMVRLQERAAAGPVVEEEARGALGDLLAAAPALVVVPVALRRAGVDLMNPFRPLFTDKTGLG
jgi:hypothetical protein